MKDSNQTVMHRNILTLFYKFLPVSKCKSGIPEEKVEMLNGLVHFSSGIISIIDGPSRRYLYMSDNTPALLGYSKEEFYAFKWENTIRLFPEDQQEIIVNKVFSTMFEFLKEAAKDGTTENLSFTYSSKLVKADGTEAWFLHQMKVFETDENHVPLYFLKLLTCLDDIKKDNSITFTIKKKKGNEIITVFSQTYFPQTVHTTLSQREMDVLKLLTQGYTSKKIADTLFLSEHTVLKHRKNMLKKLDVSRTGELVTKCISLGLV